MTLVVIKAQRPRKPAQQMPDGPVGGLLDPRFRYTPPLETDIRKTFKRRRAELSRGERL
jgi:hypothetical protein